MTSGWTLPRRLRAAHPTKARPRIVVVTTGVLAVVAALAALTTPANARPTQIEAAATALEAAVAPGGAGYRFEVSQRQVVYPVAGASDIPVIDRGSPGVVARRVDHQYVNTVLARGQVAPGQFAMEMRFGPDETTTPDYDVAPTMFRVVTKNGVVWRNDGLGWYQTSVSPGVGMDPTTASLLPSLLRSVTDATDLGGDVIGGVPVHGYRTRVDVAVFPGVVASDGASFTESPIGVDLWFDGLQRLVAIEGRARNTNEAGVDLRIVTRIGILYVAAGPAPEPSPLVPSPSASGVRVGNP